MTETNPSPDPEASADKATERAPTTSPEPQATATFVPETQGERWMKYGANVVLASVVVVLLAAALTYIAQKRHRRIDTTAAHAYSLKPQTKNILKDLKGPIKIYSLYTTRGKGGAAHDDAADSDAQEDAVELRDHAQIVSDLLDEYRRNSGQIQVETIDPVASPTKIDDLIEYVTNKYGGEVQKYKQFLDAYPTRFERIKKLTTAEEEQVQKLPVDEINKNPDLAGTVVLAIMTVRSAPVQLDKYNRDINRLLKQKPPDYKSAADGVKSLMGQFSQMLASTIELFARFKDDPKVPEAVRAYIHDSLPRYEEIKKQSDALVDDANKLGELKLDELRQSLKARNAILVMGEKDMRVLPAEQVWQLDPNLKRAINSGRKLSPRFAGEQQISTAILALGSEKKPKVAFIRAGGPPLASGGPFQQSPLSVVAGRLRDYNFDVLEKDLSGMYAMQAQAQGMPVAPEPGDDQLKDAVWVVIASPSEPGPMGPPPSIAPKLAEHLKFGGSAVVLFLPKAEDLSPALDEWGIKANTTRLAVHQKIESAEGVNSNDLADAARRIPFIFVLTDYGQHMLAKPLASLDLVLPGVCPIDVKQLPGYTASTLLPIPDEPKSWSERDVDAAFREGDAQFNPSPDGTGDLPGPLFGGAAVEKQGGGRVVAIGCVQFITNQIVTFADREMQERGLLVTRFPGNAELFLNSVFWTAKMEPLIAISPAAMEVDRIKPMAPATLRFWRVGVVLVGLPALVVIAGVLTYLKRRD